MAPVDLDDFNINDVCQRCFKPWPSTVFCDECAKDMKCPHGEKPSECSTCAAEGDLAFDAARERKCR